MSGPDALSLEITSDPAELPKVRTTVRNWSKRHDWQEDQIADIVLAVDEALSNVIRHGYDGEPGHKIKVAARMIEDPSHGPGLEISIRDFGKQVELDSIRGRDLDDLRPGGLGVHIIRSVMSCTKYSHADGGGMQLVMRKYKHRAGEDSQSPTEKP